MNRYKTGIEKVHGPAGRDLRLLMNHTSDDETRPIFHGIFRDSHCLVATDGRRMFISKQADLMCCTTDHINKILGGVKTISSLDSIALLQLHKQYIDGTFPSYERAMPNVEMYNKCFAVHVPTWVGKIKGKIKGEL